MGNHDAVAAGLEEPTEFNPIARKAVLWTRTALEEKNVLFLKEQPECRTLPAGVKLVHGSLLYRDHYLLSRGDLQENLRRMHDSNPSTRILFFGHTHYQVAFVSLNGDIHTIGEKMFYLKEDAYFIVNPGSVGQPRDHDPRAAFLIYDDEVGSIQFLRTSYNIETCTQRILSAGLPKELAERLYQGW
jgi:diadenosine tetraphosphatase ApaH/serine/threonine PP2A family protein phosphatase